MVDLSRRLLELLDRAPGSVDGLVQRLGRGSRADQVDQELGKLQGAGLVTRRVQGVWRSKLDEFTLTDAGRSLLGELRREPEPFRFPLADTVESPSPELNRELVDVLVQALFGAVQSVAQLTEAANRARGVSWVTEGGVLAVLRANPDTFREFSPGTWTIRIEPGAQGAPVPAAVRPPTLDAGAEASLTFDDETLVLIA